MNSTDVLRFLQDLVDNPQELRKYKQDPAKYLAQTNLAQDVQRLLGKFSNPTSSLSTMFIMNEVSTVFQLNISPNPWETPPQAAEVGPELPLEGTEIQLVCHSSPVIIERTDDLPCRLLLHSYIHRENGVPFKLHLSYTYPYDPTDQVFVIEIRTTGLIPEDVQFNRADAKVSLTAFKPVVMKYDKWVYRKLVYGSYYNRSTGELVLVFDNPSDAEDNT
jgi:hypothetical protein